MRRTHRTIYAHQLISFSACRPQRTKFRHVFGNSALFSTRTAQILFDKFSFTWLPLMLEPREKALWSKADEKLWKLHNTDILYREHGKLTEALRTKFSTAPTKHDIDEWHRIKTGHAASIREAEIRLSEARAVLAMRYWLRYGPRDKV
jgi:hypothetical protein